MGPHPKYWGEALNRLRSLDPETAARISDLHGAIALRNILSHGHETVDDNTVWTIVQHDVPVIVTERRALVGQGGRRRLLPAGPAASHRSVKAEGTRPASGDTRRRGSALLRP